MIRINLLATERKAKAVAPGFQAGQKMMLLGSVIVVLAVALIGWRYWSLGQQEAQLKREIATATREEERLQEVLKQVAEFQSRKEVLEARVALIDELRKGQTAPVHMIAQISKALPELTWLTSLQQSGYTVQMQGRCLTLTSLSDFVGNLEASRYFARPVEIIETSVSQEGGTNAPELISFTIRGTFQMAGVETEAPAAAGTKGPGGRRG